MCAVGAVIRQGLVKRVSFAGGAVRATHVLECRAEGGSRPGGSWICLDRV